MTQVNRDSKNESIRDVHVIVTRSTAVLTRNVNAFTSRLHETEVMKDLKYDEETGEVREEPRDCLHMVRKHDINVPTIEQEKRSSTDTRSMELEAKTRSIQENTSSRIGTHDATCPYIIPYLYRRSQRISSRKLLSIQSWCYKDGTPRRPRRDTILVVRPLRARIHPPRNQWAP